MRIFCITIFIILIFFQKTEANNKDKIVKKKKKMTECPTAKYTDKRRAFFANKLTNKSEDEERNISLGFVIGPSLSALNIKTDPEIRKSDGVKFLDSKLGFGFTFGFILNRKIDNFIDFRLVPQFVVSYNAIEYVFDSTNAKTVFDAGEFGFTSNETTLGLPTVLFELPVRFKTKALRINNNRLYFISGAKYSRNLANLSRADNSPLELNKNNIFLEFGPGIDLYRKFSRFGFHLIYSYGLIDILKKDNSFRTNSIESIYNNTITLQIKFE